jgi:hypothetical protein
MLRIGKWGGLITAVSPYVVPAGGSVEQVNAQSISPGQLSVRGGMQPISPRPGSSSPILEMWGYSVGSGGTEVVFTFHEDGKIRQAEMPVIETTGPRTT